MRPGFFAFGGHNPNKKGKQLMAITLTANYQKRLGLPGYSSHSFQVSLESEITDLGNVQGEVTRLYGLLQDAVDREMHQTGFVPPDGTYGMENATGSHAGPQQQAHHQLPGTDRSNGSNAHGSANGHYDRWNCSDKQKELILKLVTENNLDRDAVETTAADRFGVGVKQLNKLQASGLIDELFEIAGNSGRKRNGAANGYQRKGGGQ